MELHRIKRTKLTADLELFEAFIAILEAERNVVERHLQVLHSILEDILTSGVQSGEFQIADIRQATAAVSAATLKFHHPLMIRESMNEPTEEQAGMVVKLLTKLIGQGFT